MLTSSSVVHQAWSFHKIVFPYVLINLEFLQMQSETLHSRLNFFWTNFPQSMWRILMLSLMRFFLLSCPCYELNLESKWASKSVIPQLVLVAHILFDLYQQCNLCDSIFWRQPNPRVSWYFWRCSSNAMLISTICLRFVKPLYSA